ncbi:MULTISPECIES: polyprenyl synthetase family protein [unclassified Sulfitobacter]|jgi:farnesyl diphosphate synthase|uniref:polyprenyl synthetase family protein n=1 Tax=unclassified Sulfitobacter TaxID=196795 RepID=UPI0007C29706|nr:MULTISPECIES: farnesyl diphosphate synthase [unclassified Sulfitobacter]KZX93240.1 farnesyl-diphosphate synthase [Sulfitobacter sp. HI0021]KZY02248.1 farnesyl-diphosphate synthase [Sulfitobacter sp. HI0027]KZZ03521.1 farnesyl-diphosphate synthase [Sulfitobacter sp. HI0076]
MTFQPTPLPLAEALAHARDLAQAQIEAALAERQGPVADAMRYACAGGKGLRGFLVIESARLHGIAPGMAAPAAAAIEALHAYSLVHDDLPCMDDDDLRRGQPTVHRKWDEATAVLAGDALQTLAFELLGQLACPAEARLILMTSLAQAAGVGGMVGGQALDIAAETAPAPLSLAEITALQAGKTGALIEWSAMAGPRMAGADATALGTYAKHLGLAFQIADDILDVEGDAETVGKAVGKDDAAGKATFVSHLGLAGAKTRAAELVDMACDALSEYGPEAQSLRAAAAFVIARDS